MSAAAAKDRALEALVGIPFEFGAESPMGADCYGLARMWYASRGVDLPPFERASDDPLDEVLGQAAKRWERIGDTSAAARLAGDVLFGLIGGAPHVAVLVDPIRRTTLATARGHSSYLAPAWSAQWCTAVYRLRRAAP